MLALASTARAQSFTLLPLDSSRRVVASSPVTQDLAARMAADWVLYPAPSWHCVTGLHTDALVSWKCNGTVANDGKTTKVGVHRALAIPPIAPTARTSC